MKTVHLLTTEVVPDKIYLAPFRTEGTLTFRPATVLCTNEPGWLRGFVDVRPSQTHIATQVGYVTVRFVEDGHEVDVPVYRRLTEGSEWVFAVGPDRYHPSTLKHMPPNYFEQRVLELREKIDHHTLAIGRLEDTISKIKALETRCRR